MVNIHLTNHPRLNALFHHHQRQEKLNIIFLILLVKTKLNNKHKIIRKVFVVHKYDQIMDYVLNRIRIDPFYLYIHFENHVHTLIFDKLIFEIQPNHSKNIYVQKKQIQVVFVTLHRMHIHSSDLL